MKLILLYGGGDGGESYFDATQPIEYESKEKLKQDLFVLVREAVEKWKNRRTWTLQEWRADSKKAHVMAADKNSPYYLRYDDIMKNEMGYINEIGDFKLCGLTLNAACFCVGGYDHFIPSFHYDYLIINEESINGGVLTLDEWFEREAIKN